MTPKIKAKSQANKIHYAMRLVRSVRHFGETVWQPLCGVSDTEKMTMTTALREVTCLHCRNKLVKTSRVLGLTRQINQIRRTGAWE